mgnify:CR=1 FL=1
METAYEASLAAAKAEDRELVRMRSADESATKSALDFLRKQSLAAGDEGNE